MTILRSEGAGESSGDFYGYKIGQSLRFDSVRSTVLTRTATTPTDGKKATWSFWIKKSEVTTSSGSYKSIFYAGTPNSNGFRIGFRKSTSHNHEFTITMDNGSSAAHMFKYTDAAFRDASSWYHFVLRYDSTDSTAADRIKLYVNGTQQTFSSGTNVSPTLNRVPTFQVSGQTQRIGEGRTDVNEHINAYLAELHFVDGQALDPSSFGETQNGIWVAKEYSGSHGDNGFYLTFQATGTGTTAQGTTAQTNIGDDQSGEGHNFAVSALVASDVVPDSLTNNFSTYNPLDRSGTLFSEGNLKVGDITSSAALATAGTMAMRSGKWYFEILRTSGVNGGYWGIIREDQNILDGNHGISSGDYAYYVQNNGTLKLNAASTSSWITAYSTGDIIQVAYDADTGKVWFGRNNTWGGSGDPANGTSEAGTVDSFATYGYKVWTRVIGNASQYEYATLNCGQDSSFAGAKTSGSANAADGNGIGDFYYAPPSGFLALASSNLPKPAIIDGTEYFNTVLYTGNDGTQSITGVGFQPDLVWLKQRSATTRSHRLNDSVRGANKQLYSNLTDTEGTATNELTSFDSDGFSLGSANGVNGIDTYVGWNWLAGTAFSNDASATGVGTIDSEGQVNATAGFSIIKYTGTGSNGTIAHGLSSAPNLVIVKGRNEARQWAIGSDALTDWTKYLLFTTASEATAADLWNSTAPSSSVFSVGTNINSNKSTVNYIAYCFHSVDGYSKVGSYAGNGADDGAFVYTGFRPAWTMIKRTNTTDNWVIDDAVRSPINEMNNTLYANLNNEEYTGGLYGIDFLSNGFKIRDNDGNYNNGSSNYIYLAFAEQPFKFANAR